MTFRVGDVVRVTRAHEVNQVGEIYTIEGIHPTVQNRYLTTHPMYGNRWNLCGNYLQLVSAAPEPQPPAQETYTTYLVVYKNNNTGGIFDKTFQSIDGGDSWLENVSHVYPGRYQVLSKKKITVRY